MVSPAAIDIYVRTYFRDFRWLELSLRSVAKYVAGYRRIVVEMPRSSAQRFNVGLIPDPARTVVASCDDYADDYVGQQISKLHADQCTDSAVITHVDSDCVFEGPCDLSRLLDDGGRPIISVWSQSRRPVSDGWRQCVVDFYGQPLPFDALTAPPWTYSRGLYASLREACQRRHHTTLQSWCLARRCDTVSEFSLLGAQAWFNHRDEYHWVTADAKMDWPCRQYWSRSPHADQIRAALTRQLAGPPP
jgi:hypothetical protein